jgi:hypothetical protein
MVCEWGNQLVRILYELILYQLMFSPTLRKNSVFITDSCVRDDKILINSYDIAITFTFRQAP